MIEINDLKKSFGVRILWQGLSHKFLPGTMTALTGASGSGKSTLLNCLGTLDKPSSGQILVEDVDLLKLSTRKQRLYRKNTVGYLFQDYALIPDRTVKFNLQLAVEKHKWPEIPQVLHAVGLESFEEKPVFELSGGEQQRTALARVLLKNPRIILADEPTGALDLTNSELVIEALRALADKGATVVVATHSPLFRESADTMIKL
ncbi:ABC transporter ATP-binding protein [Corynebacterium glutamicum]|uniref:ABC transporter ATP-binding protein n=1 Tax=Corynebacterium glutamicum TaxID=1718 RepID=UPI00058A5FDB|nr:ATP-binding cassette domain-containing protein [Corynebacterium glutamicum]AJE66254.1 peptide ABC transporter ATPase [Corynebacterium glutamicum]OKX87226.1 lipoprotein ABC transporter ATP-binding protein [Corynebacterium glutamicum]TWS32269.1 peptide ABC transporter ATPase [Corynebacterium glutamicum]